MIDEPDSNRPSGKPLVTPTAGSYYPTMALAAEQIVDLYERHARDFDQERGAAFGRRRGWTASSLCCRLGLPFSTSDADAANR